MKYFTLFSLQILFSLCLHAQKDVTQFLGIPVDGSKAEMVKKLKEKGYVISISNKDVLVGEFNGVKVNINIATNNNKVCRIMVSDANSIDEAGIKIRFNKLCQQFLSNDKYISASLSNTDYLIPENEDISYGITVNNKRYEAVFYQLPIKSLDSAMIGKELQDHLLKKYTKEQIANPTEEVRKILIKESLSFMLDKYSKKVVWFMINEIYGRYYISIYYDNEYNRSNGEDL